MTFAELRLLRLFGAQGEFQHPLDRLMAVALRPVPEGVVVEDPLEERTQELAEHLLSNAVADSGAAQWTPLPVDFGDVDTTEREGLKRPLLQLPHQGQ
jgi:hypothetical protein